ncbi:probable calcium-binding protein CML14 [Beta vulgaris subsp. vulgaris]|uniref:probable calcium-binding protein CML14 n=1 Tax=Beta vulgaris subsp. vulgaris TaxID=3555 RepID=UPI00203692EB|nr:probable calcium-binding protein CML14 [Beta vulgaris subsp. vulgaris]
MHISKARERLALPNLSQKYKFKDASLVYLLSKAKHKFSLNEIKERRKWRLKAKKLKHSTTKLKETFSLYDKDGDGKVDPSNLGVMIRTLGGNPTEAQVNDILTKENLNGPFDYDRFVDLIKKHLWVRPKKHELHKAFKVIDNDDDGFVEVTKLRHILTTMGESLDEEEFDDWIQSLGVNNEGKVSYQEIISPMVASPS